MQRSEPPPASQVRRLHYVEGKTYREIAAMYGISIPLAYALAHQHEVVEVATEAPESIPFADADLVVLMSSQ